MSEQATFANVTFAYEFVLPNGEPLKGATLGISVGAEKRQPEFHGSEIKCDLERVFTLKTSNAGLNPKIFWADDIFGAEGDGLLMLGHHQGVPHDIALLQVHENETWIARSEPTLDKRLAITVSNQKNKVLLLGVGDLVEVDFEPNRPGLPPKKGHELIATLHETYKWIQSNPVSCASCAGSVRQSTPAAWPNYSAPDGGTCFAAGTPVVLGDNVARPIEELRVGDLVLTRCEDTQRVTTRPIRHIWMHNGESTVMLQLANGEQIETTAKHRFAVVGKGFEAASSLRVGSKLITHTEMCTEVAQITSRAEPVLVYNLEVEEFHTYFVGNAGAWVHNAMKR